MDLDHLRRHRDARPGRRLGGDRRRRAARSVDAAIFDQTHEPIDGDRWRRVGEVRGRQARPGEVVHSLEGDQTARPGQWVLRGVAGEEWLVSTEHLEATYDRMEA